MKLPRPLSSDPIFPLPPASGNPQSFLSVWIYLFWAFHMNEIIHCVNFVSSFLLFAYCLRTPCCSMNQYFLPLDGHAMYEYTPFGLSINGYVCGFYLLAMVNSAAVTVCIEIPVRVPILRYLRLDLLGYMVILCLAFWETASLLSMWLSHFTFPPAM